MVFLKEVFMVYEALLDGKSLVKTKRQNTRNLYHGVENVKIHRSISGKNILVVSGKNLVR